MGRSRGRPDAHWGGGRGRPRHTGAMTEGGAQLEEIKNMITNINAMAQRIHATQAAINQFSANCAGNQWANVEKTIFPICDKKHVGECWKNNPK